MKSRVNKNMELHQSLSMSFETETPSKDLSHYANRLNEIDGQFRRVEVEDQTDHHPQRARALDLTSENQDSVHVYDTFENTYLKDFLNEVKEYNVKKGYRKIEDTQSNIVTDLNVNTRIGHDEIRSVLRDMNFDDVETEETLDQTKVFRSSDLSEDLDSVISSLDETLTLNTFKEEVTEVPEVASVQSKDTEEIIIPFVEVSQSISELDDREDLQDFSIEEDATVITEQLTVQPNLDDTFKRTLLEQTQTLQYKIIDQERHIEDMNDVMIRTNRLLHAVISILLLAIFVVIVLVVAQLVA